MNSSNKHDSVPDWSLQLTEQLISPPQQQQQQQQPTTDTANKTHISSLPPSAIIVHQTPDDEQFENYIDRQFTSRDAKLLKNRLSEATTLRNSSTIPTNDWKDIEKTIPATQQQQAPPHPYHHHLDQDDQQSEESNVWWVTKNDQDGFYSICGLLFLFGFLFPPLWWIGSIWPRHVREKGGKMADRWQKLNRIMSIGFSSILIILIIVFVVLYATGVY
ncbi:unnamed protein product [Mucor circinelloides]|uniref:Uncharacterized protein n=1 Tax=Mucor circinelloides f. circinelloides (strain 1006PhL) TaxID=1220926 RepID=S2JBU0_MUCC1|nr:hypothetical protein HMPREF1544_05956 [Mucor circinelloides 1006PhL]KAG1079628.1 hypothetical protein G6F42_023675 [Rhizopus arrhizus]